MMDSLMLIDSDSSNGTFWNRIRLPAQVGQSLRDGDVIAFGRANFLLKIIKAPSFLETKTLI
jgi:pSer/pThr/pTyr-binding forkhead associated (FHA) protein